MRWRVSKLTSTIKGSKLNYDSYIEMFKVNFNVKRFKVNLQRFTVKLREKLQNNSI